MNESAPFLSISFLRSLFLTGLFSSPPQKNWCVERVFAHLKRCVIFQVVSLIGEKSGGFSLSIRNLTASRQKGAVGNTMINLFILPHARFLSHLSHTLTVQAAMIHREILKTSSTVPGHMVISVFITNRVLKCT